MIRQPTRGFRMVVASAFSLAMVQAAMLGAAEIPDDQRNFFEKHVRPLLTERCLECHAVDSDELGGNLQLDSRAGWSRGGDLGPAIVPGDPEQSLVIQAVRHTHEEVHMPPEEKLPEGEIRVLVEWVKMGAPDPRTGIELRLQNGIDLEEGREHWSFQSPHGRQIPVPAVQDRRWPVNVVDYFVLAELERRGLTPSPPADRLTLIRRATFDLTGLPPTPAAIHAFQHDDSPEAYAKLIDRLLASPHYGERWGRFWLDVGRYADSNGLDENIAHGNAWRYRDYVIAALNRDKPYDQFVREQLAGDLLSPVPDEAIRRERAIATGFLSLGPKVLAEVDETKMEMDIVDEQVETVGRAFMGLTLGCARCHDHKFDPITTEDYYALAGIFKSTKTMEHFTKIARWNEVVLASQAESERHAAQQRKIDTKQSEIDEFTKALKKEQCGGNDEDADAQANLMRLKQELSQLQSELPELPTAMGVTDYDKATNLRVHVRGSFLSLGELVPRGFPAVLVSSDTQPTHFRYSSSGRLELAEWLVNGRHPLVARVMVNRMWRWHFGRGLVNSTDNFGQLGDRPDNQPLLDWLAVRFVESGWSIKQLHRLLMLSATYQMSSQHDLENSSIDEENRFHWRANVWRLEAEAIRDAMLAVSGRLDPSVGGSLLHVKNREFLFDHTSKDETKYDSTQRSVYLPVIRNHLYDAFQLFDYTDASVMHSNRSTTTVAPQALFMMNSDFVMDTAAEFAARVCRQADNDQQRIEFAYELALGRLPRSEETRRAKQYLMTFDQYAPLAENVERGNERPVGISSNSSIQAALHMRPQRRDLRRAWILFCQTLLMSNEFLHVR